MLRNLCEAVYRNPAVEYNGQHMQNSNIRMLYIPRLNIWTRLLTVLYGILIFLWLSPEDNTVWPVALIGAGFSLLLVSLLLMRQLGGRAISDRYVVPGALLLGALIGLGASLSITFLMFFKNALHAHVFLDFPGGMLLSMLGRAPGWTLAGAFIGVGIALIWWAVKRK